MSGSSPWSARLSAGACLALATFAVSWAALVIATPRLAASGRTPGTLVAAGVYTVGAGLCHQRPDRSFSTAGVRWPVCARCAGLYLGAAVGVLGGVARLRPGRRRSHVSWRTLLLASALPSAASWLVEAAGGPATPLVWRALLALPAGVVVGALVVTVSAPRRAGSRDASASPDAPAVNSTRA